MTTLTTQEKTRKFEETEEFHVLRPFCVLILQNPSCSNFKKFQDAFAHVPEPPQHLSEYVLFPFGLHLKMLHNYKENERISLFSCMTDVLAKLEISSWDMFIEVFQRLHLALGSKENPTTVNTEISDDELYAITSCILSLVQISLPLHIDQLFDDTKIHILAHSVVIFLQVINLDTLKKIRISSMKVVASYATACEELESASRRFFRFLPGILNSLRKIINVKAGRVYQDIVLEGVQLLQNVIAVSVKYEDILSLDLADLNMSPVLSELSHEILLHDNAVFRMALTKFSIALIKVINGKMKRCEEVLLNNLLVMRFDIDAKICRIVTNFLSKSKANSLVVTYDDILATAKAAIEQLNADDDRMCHLSLRKLSAFLTVTKFNFVETRGFLPVLFNLVTRVINCASIEVDEKPFKPGDKKDLCANLCKALIHVGTLEDVLEEFDLVFSSFEGDLGDDFLGSIFCFNQILLAYVDLKINSEKIVQEMSEFEVMQFANSYLALLDMQSTSGVLAVLEFESPRIQSAVDVRKAYLLNGLSIMGQMCSDVFAIVLYPLVEYSGLGDSEIISRTANNSLLRLSKPKSMNDFLSEHLSLVMNELSVRILNLAHYPNCPNALIFLAEYFDFRQQTFVKLVDQVLSRSCDPFCGGHLQPVYAKVFYAFVLSLWKQQLSEVCTDKVQVNKSQFLATQSKTKPSLMQRLLKYQKSIGMETSSVNNLPSESLMKDEDFSTENAETENDTKTLSSELNLVLRICHRVLNFLPNKERTVRLLGMDCLIKGISILRNQEDSLLPLAHTVWQNLIPRFLEKDLVVVRKSFELLLILCSTCGGFLKKRILEEVFPKLSSILLTLAHESEQVVNKNRQYYTYTQAYKLQLTLLQGMADLCNSLDIGEDALDKIVDGCIVYLNPQQHRNLKEASGKLLESLAANENSRSFWMKLVSLKLRNIPPKCHPSFTSVPESILENRPVGHL